MQKINKLFVVTVIMILFFSLMNINYVYACVSGNKPPEGMVVKCGYVTPEEAQPHNHDEDYVGSNIELKEGEAGITSVEEPKILIEEGKEHEKQTINGSSEQPQILKNSESTKKEEVIKVTITDKVKKGPYVEKDNNMRLLIPITISSVIAIISIYFYMKRNKKD